MARTSRQRDLQGLFLFSQSSARAEIVPDEASNAVRYCMMILHSAKLIHRPAIADMELC